MFGAESSSFTPVTPTNLTTSSNTNSATAQTSDDTEKKGAKGSPTSVMGLCFWHLGFEVQWCSWWRWVIGLWRWRDPMATWPSGVNESNLYFWHLFLDFFFFLMGLRHPYPIMECNEDQKYSVMKNKKKESYRWERKGKWLDKTVGSMHVCLNTTMPWKLSFNNLKTPKMCFQFP